MACRDIICGTPQGSLFGPKLFLLYMLTVQMLKIFPLADDSNIFCSVENLQLLLNEINEEKVENVGLTGCKGETS